MGAGEPREPLGAAELRDRAASGAALMGARGALIYALGIVANLVLAALLAPRDFGLVALGTVVLFVGTYAAQNGFSAALIRSPQEPTRRELEAVLGVQLLIAVLLGLAVVGGALPAGNDGLVVATMAAALPVLVLRTPALVLLERRLEYRTIASADVLEAAVYYGWSVATVALGMGVWGLATAVVVRAIAGTAWLLAAGPVGFVPPRWAPRGMGPLLGSGLRFQAAALAGVGRDQIVNVGVGLVGGLATLGIWNLAWRVLQVPLLLFSTVGRVAFPTLARLLDAGEDPRPVIERVVAALAVLTGLVVVSMVAVAPALPEIVGREWGDVPAVLLWSAIALVVNAPITAAAGGYLMAAGRPGAVTVATLASTATWLGVMLPLLDPVGPAAIGLGWIAAGVVASAMLWRPTAAATGVSVAGRRLAPTLLAVAGAVAAWFVARAPDEPFLGAALGLVAGELVLAGGLFVFARAAVDDLLALGRRTLPLR